MHAASLAMIRRGILGHVSQNEGAHASTIEADSGHCAIYPGNEVLAKYEAREMNSADT